MKDYIDKLAQYERSFLPSNVQRQSCKRSDCLFHAMSVIHFQSPVLAMQTTTTVIHCSSLYAHKNHLRKTSLLANSCHTRMHPRENEWCILANYHSARRAVCVFAKIVRCFAHSFTSIQSLFFKSFSSTHAGSLVHHLHSQIP